MYLGTMVGVNIALLWRGINDAWMKLKWLYVGKVEQTRMTSYIYIYIYMFVVLRRGATQKQGL
jgi:hypothetical protein